jgi:hypothetical protein
MTSSRRNGASKQQKQQQATCSSSLPTTVHNYMQLTAEEAEQHDARGLQQLRQDEPAFVGRVERLLDAVRAQVMC